MTATTRQIISALLSLLLVLSGPVLAVSEISDGQADSVMMESNCVTAPGMACSSAGSLSQCGMSFALLLAAPENAVANGSQPLSIARLAIYQNPFLASITPPPLPHS